MLFRLGTVVDEDGVESSPTLDPAPLTTAGAAVDDSENVEEACRNDNGVGIVKHSKEAAARTKQIILRVLLIVKFVTQKVIRPFKWTRNDKKRDS